LACRALESISARAPRVTSTPRSAKVSHLNANVLYAKRACIRCTAKSSTIRKLFPATSDSPQVAPHFCQFDSLVQTYKTGYLRGGNRNPIQRAGRWWVLHTNPGLRAAVEKPGR